MIIGESRFRRFHFTLTDVLLYLGRQDFQKNDQLVPLPHSRCRIPVAAFHVVRLCEHGRDVHLFSAGWSRALHQNFSATPCVTNNCYCTYNGFGGAEALQRLGILRHLFFVSFETTAVLKKGTSLKLCNRFTGLKAWVRCFCIHYLECMDRAG